MAMEASAIPETVDYLPSLKRTFPKGKSITLEELEFEVIESNPDEVTLRLKDYQSLKHVLSTGEVLSEDEFWNKYLEPYYTGKAGPKHEAA